jgi:hypothetical protein
MEFYESLGLSPGLRLDAEDLKRRFYGRSRNGTPIVSAAQARRTSSEPWI